jgi:hypothetical protein
MSARSRLLIASPRSSAGARRHAASDGVGDALVTDSDHSRRPPLAPKSSSSNIGDDRHRRSSSSGLRWRT